MTFARVAYRFPEDHAPLLSRGRSPVYVARPAEAVVQLPVVSMTSHASAVAVATAAVKSAAVASLSD